MTHNEARYGVSSRYVLERVRSITQQPHVHDSAVALMYSGNNEFLHLTPGDDSGGRGTALMSAEDRDAIVEMHYQNLEDSLVLLQQSGIEVVLSTIPTNLRDWPPSYSVLSGDATGETELRYARAASAHQSGRTDEAERLVHEILRFQPELAQAHFLFGTIHLAAERHAEARQSLIAANDFDGRPIRAISAINQNIRTLATEHGARLLDAEASFAAAAPDGICGNAQFWDDCHPKLDGYLQLADLLNSHLADIAGIGDAPPTPSIEEVQRRHGIDHAFLADMYGRNGLYCYKHSDCWDSERTLELAEQYLRRALAMAPLSSEVHIALAFVLGRRGDSEGARKMVRMAIEHDREHATWLLHGREARVNFGALGIADVERWALGQAADRHEG